MSRTEADLRAERRAAALAPLITPLPEGGYPLSPERLAEHRNLTRQAIPDRDGTESARLYALERKAVAPKCDTLGHEYNFGICLDCEQVDPAFEPTDDMIEADYLNRTFAA